MKGLFIPGITVEMFRNGCLEAIETLMAEGEIYDIDYDFNKPEPCEDTISRQAALDAVFNNAESPNKAYKAIRILPSAQPEPCEDAISRKQIKEKLQYVIDHGFAAADGHHPVSAERVLGYIIKMSSVTPKQRWIPISERLPEKGQKCLVSDKGCIVIDVFLGGGGAYNWQFYVKDYEAWMPLPEPYRKEGEE